MLLTFTTPDRILTEKNIYHFVVYYISKTIKSTIKLRRAWWIVDFTHLIK